nr:hypothetical protein [Tanacetum cinerariifolium]
MGDEHLDTISATESDKFINESFSPSPMEEINLYLNPDGPMPPGIEEDDDDSERDILILEGTNP